MTIVKQLKHFLVRCDRCGREWETLSEKLPKHCPRCNSPYWNILRKK